jgi:hypothetical protein
VYTGCFAEDHVFGSIWDQDWNHFEFFRGGLSPTGNQFFGITNLLDRGSYSWKISMVEGYRPDGYTLNFTPYYVNTCNVKLSVVDSLGNPVEGAMVQLFAPYIYGSGYLPCAHLYTNKKGTVEFKAGEAKQYLVNVSHPVYGWSPQDSTKAYYLTQGQTARDATYNVTVPYSSVRPGNQVPIVEDQLPKTGQYGLNIRISSQEIQSGIHTRDYQRSRFYLWNSESDGLVTFFVCDSLNFDNFKNGRGYTAYQYTTNLNGGELLKPLPSEQSWYMVFRNPATANILEKVSVDCELLKGEVVASAEHLLPSSATVNAFPLPVRGHCRIQTDGHADHVEIVNVLGKTVAVLQAPYVWSPESRIKPGMYFARFSTANGITTLKLPYIK